MKRHQLEAASAMIVIVIAVVIIMIVVMVATSGNHDALGFPSQPVVSQGDGDHRFSHGSKTWEQTGVVSPFCAHRGRFSVSIDGWLFLGK